MFNNLILILRQLTVIDTIYAFPAYFCLFLFIFAAAKSLQSCPTLTLWTAAHQALLSTGFSRQEYWSGLPFPSPMHACMLSRFSRVWLCDPRDSSPSGSSVHRILQVRILEWVAISFSYLFLPFINQFQFSSVPQSCLIHCDPMDCSIPGLPVHHQFPEFTQTHLHWVSDAIQPSHPLSSPFPPALIPSQHQGLFKWVSSLHQVLKYWSFSFNISPSKWTHRTDLFSDGLVGSPCSPRDSQESSPTPQFKSINSSALSFLYGPTLTSIHDYWKNHSLN